jgi:hypothetical protein
MTVIAPAQKRYRPEVHEQRAMVNYLAKRVVDDGTGVADGDHCVGDPPRARYYLSTLAPRDPNDANGGPISDRDANTSLGFETEMEDGTLLKITASCSVYYRVLPSFAEQSATWRRIGNGAVGNGGAGVPRLPVRQVYRRIEIPAQTFTVTVGKDPIEDVSRKAFDDAFAAARDAAINDARAFRAGFKDVPLTALVDATTYSTHLAGLQGSIVAPEWGAHVTLIPRPGRDGRLRVNVLLVNDSVQPMLSPNAKGVARRDDDRDHYLYRATIRVTAEKGAIKGILLDLGPDAYRYNGHLAAYALGCGVEAPGWDGKSERIPELRTVPAPQQLTYRVEPVDDEISRRATNYELLAEDPIPRLREFEAQLRRYVDDPNTWNVPDLDPEKQQCLAQDRERAVAEVARFSEGVRWLERDSRLLLAFKLANQAMIELGNVTGKTYAGWRSFQLVAIVSELTTLAWRQHPEDAFTHGIWGQTSADPTEAATVVFFPTGGGKTEMYLGATAVAMFYDRIRGKGRGITSICRFPLKLLTLNQCQRLVDFVFAAERVRADNAAAIVAAAKSAGGTAANVPFEVGLLIGSADTPNRLSQGEWLSNLQNPELLEKIRVVDRCPSCKQRKVRVKPPAQPDLRLDHVCNACNTRIPIMITDGEVYRYLPPVVVGTVDKLAMLGLTDRFGMVLGDCDSECTLHGLARGGKCVEKGLCEKIGGQVVSLTAKLVDPSPTFEIVDELHLLTEELGAFDGQYETAFAEIQRMLTSASRADRRGIRPKILATTATIRGWDRQIDHLFGLVSIVTPTMGPLLNETFFWRRDFESPMRLFVGILPTHGKTAEMTVVRILSVLHAAIQDLKRNGNNADPGFAHMAPENFTKLLELYRRSLTYTGSLVDLGKLHRSIPTQVDAYLIERGYDPVKFEMLYSGASREGIGEVRRITEDLEKNDGTTDAVIATSSVSHGLDIDRLNLMIFNGQPKQTAEYIQASSRVGRFVEGLVFIVINPRRERDRSIYRYHGKYHEYLDRQVNPVAINRWSKNAGKRTFPGIFMALVLQVLNRQWWDKKHAPKHLHQLEQMQQALSDPAMSQAKQGEITAALIRLYKADRPEALELRRFIEQTVQDVLGQLKMAAATMGGTRSFGDYRATSDFLGMGYTPMISLRDVDTGIPFWLERGRK